MHVRPLFRSHKVAVQAERRRSIDVGMAHNDPLYLPAPTARPSTRRRYKS